MSAHEYGKSNDGFVHLVSAIAGEFSLCGNAFDGESGESNEPEAWDFVKRGPVTCPECIREIINCRGVKTKDE